MKNIDSRKAPDSTPVDLQTQNPLYSAHVDPTTPDSGFILLGPGRARAQNPGESQNLERAVNRQPSYRAGGM